MKRFLPALAASALFAASAAVAATDVDIMIPAPQGFKVAHQQQTDTQRIIELIPGNETLENWTDMISYHAARIPGGRKPEDLFAFLEGKYRELCREVVVKAPVRRTVNGYASVIGDLGCAGKSDKPGEGEYTRFLIIATDKGIHQVQRAWRGRAYAGKAPLSGAQLAEWDRFFNGLGICRPKPGGKPACAAYGDQ